MNQPSATNGSKYVEIVNYLREMIERDGLRPGDKLPSERSLSESLHAGRSSVREALRALELLGLIETRKGEGTFLRDFQGHQLVQLISTFILQDDKAKLDVLETKNHIQLNGLMIAKNNMNVDELNHLMEWTTNKKVKESEFFYQIIKIADNYLLFRMWTILNDYYHALGFPVTYWTSEEYMLLVDAMKTGNDFEIVKVYKLIKEQYN
ncbi:FadR/GntR family transcriptional regulator [Niallia sp. NCCP-28]|uniref:FadR/GntR family transcriptional regulator n=1 Tax=Niallia sp. NCCP-28 TaxID=2934712 RepID=UPI0020876B67|nr:GntR family transcriptional regulator [Niallia sp. NCCP-28]GKU81553.1 GntR family transcriptional regulator [Niallia sp. NCCP-28]